MIQSIEHNNINELLLVIYFLMTVCFGKLCKLYFANDSKNADQVIQVYF